MNATAAAPPVSLEETRHRVGVTIAQAVDLALKFSAEGKPLSQDQALSLSSVAMAARRELCHLENEVLRHDQECTEAEAVLSALSHLAFAAAGVLKVSNAAGVPFPAELEAPCLPPRVDAAPDLYFMAALARSRWPVSGWTGDVASTSPAGQADQATTQSGGV